MSKYLNKTDNEISEVLRRSLQINDLDKTKLKFTDYQNNYKELWFHYSIDYIYASKILSEKLIKDFEINEKRLIVPLFFSIRHTIELILKFLAINFGEKDFRTHDIYELFLRIKEKIDNKTNLKTKELASKLKKTDEEKLKSHIESNSNKLFDFVLKYYFQFPFANQLKRNDFWIEDIDNELFRYPLANKIKITFSRNSIKNITKGDIVIIDTDLKDLQFIVAFFRVLFDPEKLKK